jgi:hypothetical protein
MCRSRFSAVEYVQKKLSEEQVVKVFIEFGMCPDNFGLEGYGDCQLKQGDYERDGRYRDCEDCWHELRVVDWNAIAEAKRESSIDLQGLVKSIVRMDAV